MGVSNSKAETCEALRLCKERKKFIKQAIDSRYNLAAAHVVYIQSLQNIGISLRKFAESQVLLDSSRRPPSPPPNGGATDTGGELESPLPHSPNNPTVNCMKSSGASAVTINLNPSNISKVYVDDIETSSFTMSPPPPPPPPRLSWDYFEPTEGSFRLMNRDRFQLNSTEKVPDFKEGFESVTPPESVKRDRNSQREDNSDANEANGSVCENEQTEECDLKNDCFTEEETGELIPHRAKDFLLSIKDIEDHFIRASKSGNEVSRMLEASKIQVSYSEATGNPAGSSLSPLTCFRGETALVLHEPARTGKVITWKRSTSSHSSLLNPPGPPANDENENNNFREEFCMIAGSHSSTLERLYAWERKLYDEVKASECIRKEYDRKCNQLRHQFAKDLKPQLIDKTRAVAKDLHSRIIVALHTVDSISKRIEKIRDEELQPQLVELIQGLIRMWKSMMESHHTQYITIASSYASKIRKPQSNEIMIQLQHEIQHFISSFEDIVQCYNSYIDSINNWLQNCITQPKERGKSKRPFCPLRSVAPPIFVISRDWSNGVRTLPSQKLGDAIKDFLSQIRRISFEEIDAEQIKNDDVMGLDLSMVHSSLTKVLDRLTRFSEASLKMYEEIKQNCETAGNVYLNYRPPPRAYSI